MYSLKTKNDINKGRYELFEKGYKSKNENEEILKQKNAVPHGKIAGKFLMDNN